jgi:hypothetical protein
MIGNLHCHQHRSTHRRLILRPAACAQLRLAGWQYVQDKDSKRYFYWHAETNLSQFEKPVLAPAETATNQACDE